jgi:hypothetical protein
MAEPTLSAGMPADFATVLLTGSDNLALVALRAGAIENGDMALLSTIQQFLNWRNGRCRATTAQLARAMAYTREQVEQGLGRLVAASLVIEGTDRRSGDYLAVHPLLCTTGGPYRRRQQWMQFHRHAADPAAVAAQAAAAGAGAAVLAA